VRRFDGGKVRVPHIGWNKAEFKTRGGLNEGADDPGYFYFVNSYYAVPRDGDKVWAETEYGGVRFTSAVRCGNIAGTQFHLEKSGNAGLCILKNFAAAAFNEGGKIC
jgi:imidazole glycerol phosphate synthase glutamine amidotransferase subunit